MGSQVQSAISHGHKHAWNLHGPFLIRRKANPEGPAAGLIGVCATVYVRSQWNEALILFLA